MNKYFETLRTYDTENQFDVLKNSFSQVEYAWNNEIDLGKFDDGKISSIIVAGLGGSAIGGELAQNFLRDEITVPYFVNRNYHLPNFADENTLVIVSSYSGNTEESISALNDAISRKCKIICVTTGGKIGDLAAQNDLPAVFLQKGFQPRYALWVNFFTLIKLFQLTKLINDQNKIVQNIIDLLKNKAEQYSREDEKAFKIAESLAGFIPIIYGTSDFTSSVAGRLKAQFNENSKLHAFFNNFPELNHNEIIGWETINEHQLNAKVLLVRDNYHPQIEKRYSITAELIREKGIETIEISSEEKNYKLRLIDMVYLGDWITYFLALIREKDPSEIDYIMYLKEKFVE